MTFRLVAGLCAAVLALTACSSSEPAEDEPAPDATEGTSEKLVEVSPLTGEELPEGRPDNPVFVVKVENTIGGAPQLGLDRADLVVEELVEGGLTRLAALFYSELPSTVGHVRSMRTTDIGIASPVGGQIIASGGAGGTYKKVRKAGVTVFSEDEGAAGFSSDPAKVRPYNRLIDLTTVAKEAKASEIHGPYFSWTPASGDAEPAADTAPTGTKATSATVRFSRSTSTSWKLTDGTWQRTNGHAPAGTDFEADTMIVMFCEIGEAGYTDPAGNPVPETELEGSGRAVLFTGDQAVEATWNKEDARSTITFEAEDGSPITVDPGKVFVELVPKGDGAVDLG